MLVSILNALTQAVATTAGQIGIAIFLIAGAGYIGLKGFWALVNMLISQTKGLSDHATKEATSAREAAAKIQLKLDEDHLGRIQGLEGDNRSLRAENIQIREEGRRVDAACEDRIRQLRGEMAEQGVELKLVRGELTEILRARSHELKLTLPPGTLVQTPEIG